MAGVMLAATFVMITLPTLSDRMRNVGDGSVEPSANSYVCLPR